jgi:hypothetical protein
MIPRSRSAVSPQAGFTVVETTIAIALGLSILAFLGTILISTTHSLDYAVKDSLTIREVNRFLHRLRVELRPSSITEVTLNNYQLDGDEVVFRQARVGSTGVQEWGTRDGTGAWVPGGSIRYVVAGGSVVRQLLDASNALLADEVALDGVTTGTDKGFRVTRSGSVLQIELRTRKTLTDDREIIKSWSTAVHVGSE